MSDIESGVSIPDDLAEAQKFKAPDESQRVEDPETAEAIARRSNVHRWEAADNRAKAKKLREVFASDVESAMDAADTQDKLAESNDKTAEAHEEAEEDFLTQQPSKQK